MTISEIKVALRRARFGIVSAALASVAAILLGMAMAHAGNEFVLRQRSESLARVESSVILRHYREGRIATAAAMDAVGNLAVATIPLVAGYWAPLVYPIVMLRSFGLGILSVGNDRESVFTGPRAATYYVVVLVLQLIPYVLLAGAGVNLGFARARKRSEYAGPTFLKVPREALRDAGRIFLLAIPLCAFASAVEFFAIPR